MTRIQPLLSRATYANVTSTLCLVLVLTGGAAYAANTVRSADIVDGEVRSIDVKNEAVRAQDLAPDSVGASEIVENAVGYREIAVGSLPSFTYTKQAASPDDSTFSKEVTVTCDRAGDADRVTGGGFVVYPGVGINVVRSYAVTENTWLVRAETTTVTHAWKLTVVADCLA